MSAFSRTLAALLVALALPSAAPAANSLEEAVAELAQDAKAFLNGKQALTISTIVPHKKSHLALHSAAGSAITQELRRQLKLVGIEVKRISDVTLSGTFTEVETANGRQEILIEIVLFDRVRGTETERARRISNEVTVGHLLGVPLRYPDDATEKQRRDALKKEVDKFVPPAQRHPPAKEWGDRPAPTFDGNRILPGKGSKFAIQVEVAPADAAKDGKRVEADYKPRAPRNDGLAFVDIKRNEVYGVRLFNDADFDVAVSLSIDGLSMFVACDAVGKDPKSGAKVALRDAKTGKPAFNHVIVPRKSSVLIRGWFVNLAQSDELKVAEYAKSLAAELKSTGDVGVIHAAFHAAVPKDDPFPPGESLDKTHGFDASATGKGARFSERYQLVERKIGVLREQVSVRYSR